MLEIFCAVRNCVPSEIICVRTKHTVSLHCKDRFLSQSCVAINISSSLRLFLAQFPFRTIQIVLRLYQSPAEILAGFDIDAPCFAFDGRHVITNPRALVALIRQANTIDITRRSPSYEMRLAKYASRGFEIYFPELKRQDVSPTVRAPSLLFSQTVSF